MTALEMQLRFEQRLQNHLEKDLDIRTIDIEYYLNEGQRRWFETWYKLFETEENARKRLLPLSTSTTLTRLSVLPYSTVSNNINGEYWTLPEDCQYITKEEATISLYDCNGLITQSRVWVKPVNLDYYNLHKDNPFKKPWEEMIWRLDIGNGNRQQELIVGSSTNQIQKYHITYVAIPTYISIENQIDSIVLPEYHEEIINEAINTALEIFKLTQSLRTKNN